MKRSWLKLKTEEERRYRAKVGHLCPLPPPLLDLHSNFLSSP
jgi:hypothetical protein